MRIIYEMLRMIPNIIPEQEKFLYYISALGTVDKSVFRQWFGFLCLRSNAKEDLEISFLENHYIRVLQSLGHIDDSEGKIRVCPPLLSFIKQGSRPIALLSGARDGHLIATLDRIISTEYPNSEVLCVRQNQYLTDDTVLLFPNALFIKNIDPNCLKDIAFALGVEVQLKEVPRTIISFAANIDQMMKHLEWIYTRDSEPINSINRVFSPNHLHFKNYWEDEKDYCLVEYRFNHLYEYWIWDETGKGATVQRDWGRYIALSFEDLNVLIYDQDSNSLAVPRNAPLPIILARAVTACSGLVPYEVRSGDLKDLGIPLKNVLLDVYFGVNQEIAHNIAEMLGQRLVTIGGVFHPEICTLRGVEHSNYYNE